MFCFVLVLLVFSIVVLEVWKLGSVSFLILFLFLEFFGVGVGFEILYEFRDECFCKEIMIEIVLYVCIVFWDVVVIVIVLGFLGYEFRFFVNICYF